MSEVKKDPITPAKRIEIHAARARARELMLKMPTTRAARIVGCEYNVGAYAFNGDVHVTVTVEDKEYHFNSSGRRVR